MKSEKAQKARARADFPPSVPFTYPAGVARPLSIIICCWWLTVTPAGARGNGNEIPAPSQGQGSVLSGSCFVSGCHATSGSTINEVGSLSLDNLPDAFEAGQTYDFTVNITGGSVYGFQLAVTFPDGSPAGTLTPVTAGVVRNQLDGVPVVNHASPLATGQADLQWTAPAEPAGPSVLFRVASNAANNNDSPTGDNIRTLSLTLSQTIECSYALASETTSFESDGGNGSAAVIAPDGCDWTATTEDDWIAIIGEANGSGNGSFDFTVDANTTASERSGSITVEGQMLTITQSGVDCSHNVPAERGAWRL